MSEVEKFKSPVIALGMFDGVHIGHRACINRAVELAKNLSGTAIVLTFSNHPLQILSPKDAPLMIGTKKLRRQIISELGADVLIELEFTKAFSKISAEGFLELLRDKLSPAYIVCGMNYTFGRYGKGNSRMLIREGDKYNFKAEICSAVTVNKKVVSSTRIRELITAGDLIGANELLGYEFTYSGIVVNGDKRGRKIGFPTANLEIEDNRAMLTNGAYIVRVKIGDENFFGIANIGDNPTFKVARRRLEVFIDKFSGDIYGEEIAVSFINKIREEKIFAGVEDLKIQLKKDLATLHQSI